MSKSPSLQDINAGIWLKISLSNTPSLDNPNCMLNALIYPADKTYISPGLGRYFPGHDGRHTRGFEKVSGSIITLEPLTGIVQSPIRKGQVEDQGNLKSYIVDVKLDKHPFYVLYKDLKTVNVTTGRYLAKGNIVGTVYPGSHSSSGFHLALIKKDFILDIDN